MMEQLIQIDHQLFYWFNQSIANPFFDILFPILRDKKTWIPLYLGLVLWLIIKYKSKGGILILFLALSITLGDIISARIIKPGFERARPCHEESVINVRHIPSWDNTKSIYWWLPSKQPCGPGYSFVSSHATNHFALATTLGLCLWGPSPWILFIGLFWALHISLGQVYIGVHFPSDIFIGSILGLSIGLFLSKMFNKYVKFEI